MGEPVKTINVGGVRYIPGSYTELPTTVDAKGRTIYNVILNGSGTKLSYPYQLKSNRAYYITDYDVETCSYSTATSPNGDKTPMVIACDDSISIFGIVGATIKGNAGCSENISLTNCKYNRVYLNDGDKRDVLKLMDSVVEENTNAHNYIRVDEWDFLNEKGDFIFHAVDNVNYNTSVGRDNKIIRK